MDFALIECLVEQGGEVHLRGGKPSLDDASCFNAIEFGQANVHQNDVWPQLLDLCHDFKAVVCLRDNPHAGAAVQIFTNDLPYLAVVVCNEHSDILPGSAHFILDKSLIDSLSAGFS